MEKDGKSSLTFQWLSFLLFREKPWHVASASGSLLSLFTLYAHGDGAKNLTLYQRCSHYFDWLKRWPPESLHLVGFVSNINGNF